MLRVRIKELEAVKYLLLQDPQLQTPEAIGGFERAMDAICAAIRELKDVDERLARTQGGA